MRLPRIVSRIVSDRITDGFYDIRKGLFEKHRIADRGACVFGSGGLSYDSWISRIPIDLSYRTSVVLSTVKGAVA